MRGFVGVLPYGLLCQTLLILSQFDTELHVENNQNTKKSFIRAVESSKVTRIAQNELKTVILEGLNRHLRVRYFDEKAFFGPKIIFYFSFEERFKIILRSSRAQQNMFRAHRSSLNPQRIERTFSRISHFDNFGRRRTSCTFHCLKRDHDGEFSCIVHASLLLIVNSTWLNAPSKQKASKLLSYNHNLRSQFSFYAKCRNT